MASEKDKALKEAVKDGLSIQPLFDAEPVYAKTGKGSMRREVELKSVKKKSTKRAKGNSV